MSLPLSLTPLPSLLSTTRPLSTTLLPTISLLLTMSQFTTLLLTISPPLTMSLSTTLLLTMSQSPTTSPKTTSLPSAPLITLRLGVWRTLNILPMRAVNTDGKWRIVVNGVKAHYETLSQTARIEECTTAGESCPLVPACYETKCLQKSIYHRFLVFDAYDKYFPFAIETFKLPSACACYNGAYVEPPHKK